MTKDSVVTATLTAISGVLGWAMGNAGDMDAGQATATTAVACGML